MRREMKSSATSTKIATCLILSRSYHNYVPTQCNNCRKQVIKKPSVLRRYKRVFCNQKCYSTFRATKLPFAEQHAYKGILKEGQPRWLYSARYRKSHPQRIAH